jgi:hypothetical protein
MAAQAGRAVGRQQPEQALQQTYLGSAQACAAEVFHHDDAAAPWIPSVLIMPLHSALLGKHVTARQWAGKRYQKARCADIPLFAGRCRSICANLDRRNGKLRCRMWKFTISGPAFKGLVSPISPLNLELSPSRRFFLQGKSPCWCTACSAAGNLQDNCLAPLPTTSPSTVASCAHQAFLDRTGSNQDMTA